MLKTRLEENAKFLTKIRDFFAKKKVLEVQTPIIAKTAGSDPHLEPIEVKNYGYLQTSPEYAMKVLLSQGSGDIFQLCKAFRGKEMGRLHNPEFSILEWYRLGFTVQDLIQEVGELLGVLLHTKAIDTVSYQEIFLESLQIDPLRCSFESLKTEVPEFCENKIDALDYLFSEKIQATLGLENPIAVFDYPAEQAILARNHPENPLVAERFEVFYQGVELGNGYNELTCPQIFQARFEKDNQVRKTIGKPLMACDDQLLKALEQGLPQCSGIALGVDRLLMLKLNNHTIHW